MTTFQGQGKIWWSKMKCSLMKLGQRKFEKCQVFQGENYIFLASKNTTRWLCLMCFFVLNGQIFTRFYVQLTCLQTLRQLCSSLRSQRRYAPAKYKMQLASLAAFYISYIYIIYKITTFFYIYKKEYIFLTTFYIGVGVWSKKYTFQIIQKFLIKNK